MKSEDPPGMSSKILSSGFSNIFMGKGHDRYQGSRYKIFSDIPIGSLSVRSKIEGLRR
jgi:hypothetical protein